MPVIIDDLGAVIDRTVRQRASLASLNEYISVFVSVLVSCCSSLLLSTLNMSILPERNASVQQ